MHKFYLPSRFAVRFLTLILSVSLCGNASAQTFPVAETNATNNTPATAMPVTAPAKLHGNIYPATDVDYYSFTANTGDYIYAATMTAFSGGLQDSQLTLYGPDGTTVIEFDEDNGSISSTSSSIAGAIIPASGTYYIKVNEKAGTGIINGYDLYLAVKSGIVTPEVEPNENEATATPLPVNGHVSGVKSTATDLDYYSYTLAAGETVFVSMDLDPEQDGVSFNGRMGVGLFGDAGNLILVVDDVFADSRPSEAMVLTATTAGTYYIYVDVALATGAATNTYRLAVTKFAAPAAGYTNYPSADIPKTIGPGTGSVSSVINIPDSKIIKDISVRINLNHTIMNQVDAVLTNPGGNSIALFTDIGASATGGQTVLDVTFNDNAAFPPFFTAFKGTTIAPKSVSKLDQFQHTNTQGNWTLTLYDDIADVNGGTLNSWSIDILEDVVPSGGTVIASEDFEATDGGYTHTGAVDEWAWGTPNTPATSVAPAAVAFLSANSGVKCWKTDLTGTYEINSSQILSSPVYDLTAVTGTIIQSWAMKFQMENARFDNLEVYAQEEGGAGLVQRMFTWFGSTQTFSGVGNPALVQGQTGGWGIYYADVSAFAGKQFRFKVRLVSDNSVNLSGVAIDDVMLFKPSVVSTSLNVLEGSRKGSKNDLHWQVSCGTETSAVISLERSSDGINFRSIHTDNASAARCAQPFDFTDATPVAGRNFYRVKTVTASGRITYTNIVLLINAEKGLQLMSVAPNPVKGSSFNLNVSSAKAGSMQVIISDAQGKTMSTQTVALIAGYNSLNIISEKLSAGNYFIQGITKDEQTATISFIKQ